MEKAGLPLSIGEFITIIGGLISVTAALTAFVLSKVAGAHNRMQKIEEHIKLDYLSKDKHGDLCKIQTLEIKQHVTKEIKALYKALKTGESAELEEVEDDV